MHNVDDLAFQRLTRTARWLEYETWLFLFGPNLIPTFCAPNSDFDVFCVVRSFLQAIFCGHHFSDIHWSFQKVLPFVLPKQKNCWRLTLKCMKNKTQTVPNVIWICILQWPWYWKRDKAACVFGKVMLSPIVLREMIQLDEWHTFQLKWGGREIASKWCLREALNFFAPHPMLILGELMCSYWHFLFSRVLNLCFQLCWWLMLVNGTSTEDAPSTWFPPTRQPGIWFFKLRHVRLQHWITRDFAGDAILHVILRHSFADEGWIVWMMGRTHQVF